MNKIVKTMLAASLTACAFLCQAETKTTYRDAQGRIQGTKTVK